MLIVERFGNIAETDADILVNTVNCVGIMGKGVALACKTKFGKKLTKPYANACNRGLLAPGQIHVVVLPVGLFGKSPQVILNAATKDHWRNPSKVEWVVSCLGKIKSWADSHPQQETIAMPMLGCGNGGLDPQKVEALIRSTFSTSNITIHLYK